MGSRGDLRGLPRRTRFSRLAAINSGRTDKFHGATLPSAAPSNNDDPMLPAMDGMEAAMLKQAAHWNKQATGEPVPAPSPSKAPTSPPENEAT